MNFIEETSRFGVSIGGDCKAIRPDNLRLLVKDAGCELVDLRAPPDSASMSSYECGDFEELQERIYDYVDRHGPSDIATMEKDMGIAPVAEDLWEWRDFDEALNHWLETGVMIQEGGKLRFNL